jgi:hypothetical protein
MDASDSERLEVVNRQIIVLLAEARELDKEILNVTNRCGAHNRALLALQRESERIRQRMVLPAQRLATEEAQRIAAARFDYH